MGGTMEVEQLARILNLFSNENEGFEEALMYPLDRN
jgi:hypothetical protein